MFSIGVKSLFRCWIPNTKTSTYVWLRSVDFRIKLIERQVPEAQETIIMILIKFSKGSPYLRFTGANIYIYIYRN